MRTILSFTAALAIVFAAASTSQADITWTAGAPNGTSGCALDFDNTTNGAGLFLDTGIAGTAIGGDRTNGGVDYTISMWINARSMNAATNGGNWFFGSGAQGLHLGQRSVANGGTVNPLAQGHWGADSAGGTQMNVGTWYHATFSFDADGGGAGTGEQTIYINGTQDGQVDNIAPNNSSTNLILGARNNGANGPQWDGQIDDVAIWNTVLTATQVSDLASGAQTATALGAQAYWDFEDDKFGNTATNKGAGGIGATDLVGITPNAVPEPSSLAIMLGLGALGLVRRKRS